MPMKSLKYIIMITMQFIYAVSVTYLLCVSTNIKEGDRTDSLKMPTKVSQGLRCSIFKKNLHIQFL